MSGRKNTLKQYKIIDAGDMSAASITSAVTNIQFLDNISLQFIWAGTTPIGVITVQVSLDYAQDDNGNVTNTGTWVSLALSPTASVTGNTGSDYIDLNQLSAPWLRSVYTKTSGTGTMNAYISAKQI